MELVSRAVSRMRGGSFYKRLLLSYMAGLLIVLLIVSLTCVRLVDTISDFSNQTAVNATAQFQATVESMVDSVQRLPTELSLYPTVVNLATTESPEFDARQRYSVIDLALRLRSYRLSNPYISDIFLYFPIQDYLVSDQGVYTLDQWMRINLPDSSLAALLARENSICWNPVGQGKKTVMCAKLPSESDLAQPVLCVFVNPELKEFSGAQGTDGLSSFYTVDPEGVILFSGGAPDSPDRDLVLNLIQRSAGGPKEVVKLQEDYIGYITSQDAHDFHYVYLSPTNAFFSTLTASKRVVVFSCSFILILGVVLSIVSARSNSRPIVRIANLMEAEGKGCETSLEAIEQSVISLVQLQKKASRDTERYRLLQQESILLKLLHQEIPNEAALKAQLEQNGVSIPGDSFLAAIVTSMGDFPVAAVAQQFCAEFRKVTPNTVDLYFFQGAGEIKIVAAGRKHSFTAASVKDGFQQAIQYLESKRQILLRVAVSGMHPALFQLGLAYEEAQRVSEYSNFIGGNLVLAYGDLLAAQSGNENSLIFDIWFNKFANTLISQDFAAAHSIQKNIFSELSKHEYSLQFIKCKIFSFIDRTINIIGELDIVYTTQLWDELKLADRLLACDTLTKLERVYSDIFSQLTQIVLDTGRQESTPERILSMVRSGYTDPNFGVSAVAEQLGVSAAYVSRVFKDTCGSNMLEYIQKLRVDLAKKLLTENPDMTVAQISEQCGFNSSITFTRVFKSFEGVPPGKYRSQSGVSPEK